MMNFRSIDLNDKELYNEFKGGKKICGCEMSFANLFLWGDQKLFFDENALFFLSTFSRSFYPFPFVKENGSIKNAIEKIIEDAGERGIECVISSISKEDKDSLEELFPNRFSFTTDEGSYDYVYAINDLKDLAGKKYHKKRNHLAQFKKACPEYKVESITKDNLFKVKNMVDEWYREKLSADPDADYEYEMDFFDRALASFVELSIEGIILSCKEKVIAVTFGTFMEEDTLDVHFEKAFADIPGAYVAINNEFAKHISSKYPQVKFLDREEDMGIEGLRKAKESYYPIRKNLKYRATLIK